MASLGGHSELLNVLRHVRSALATMCRIDIYGISGAMARGDNARDIDRDSDSDVAVRAVGRIGSFEIVEAKEYLERMLKNLVDLVSREALPPSRKKSFEWDLLPL
jgi:predicted nucleotidyltransferase